MPDDANPTAYEQSDAPPGLLAALAIGLVSIVAGLLVTLALTFPTALMDMPKGPLGALPPQPRLQVTPRAERARYEAQEAKELAGKGPGQATIEQAMREVAAAGWRTQPQ